MLERVAFANPNIFVDLHTPGIDVTLAGKVLKVTVENLTFELDYRRKVKVNISEENEWEFRVDVTIGKDENDSLAVRQVMDLICERVDDIEMSYANPRARERQESHEELKFLAALPAWMDHYKVTCRTPAQERAINAWSDLCNQGNNSRNKAFIGWTIPLPLSDMDCDILRAGVLSDEIQIAEKGTSEEIHERRERRVRAMDQLTQRLAY
ncbi:uncharacterized protein LY89DRAFT_676297 [Mollisia scopiformis]|uniref:Uncharacterized protein n=1 Tax=Mollisia scopiformis TaxID=149040 RepID=A0A132BAV1_MOLSC|nr:uncharacterized protein LY89DRAFT_676297 [Mollisia scopiformis]KUJ09516.1 hypothetical protein LY89DRAFT_676297 [Mollisia scopiformis]